MTTYFPCNNIKQESFCNILDSKLNAIESSKTIVMGSDINACIGTRTNIVHKNVIGPHGVPLSNSIRSRKQDDTDGTPNIVLPCPGSWVIFLPLQGDNFTLSILLQSPYNSGNYHLHTSENGTFVAKNPLVLM